MSDTSGVMPIASIVITCIALIIVFRVIMTITMSRMTGKKSSPQKSPSKKVFGNLEDRNNDWLAKQIREERESYVKTSAMYGLKRHHEKNCDARELRDSHSRNCDADGVDTGTSR